jgi:hypothetical protein
VETKICKVCQEEKSKDAFYHYNNDCKKCHNQRRNNYYKKKKTAGFYALEEQIQKQIIEKYRQGVKFEAVAS